MPNYFIVLVINIGIIILFDGKVEFDYWTYFLFIQNLYNPHPNFFTEAWSLSIEEYAYLILPALIYFVINSWKKYDISKLFLWTTLSTIIVLFLFKIYFYFNIEIESYKQWSAGFRKVVIYRLDAIYYGFLLVYFYTNYNRIKNYKNQLFLLGVVLFVLLHIIVVQFEVLPQTNHLFYSIFYLPLISLSIAFTFPWFICMKQWTYLRVVVKYISKRSYAIYLVNYSIVLLMLQHYFKPSLVLVFVFLVASLMLAELLYRLVERPFLNFRDRKLPKA